MREHIERRIGAPPDLRARIGRDLAVVAPLRAPGIRALTLLPFAILLLSASVLAFGIRHDASAIGVLLTWGASTVEASFGVLLCAAALREAVPGSTLTRRVVGGLFATAALAVTLVTWSTWLASPTRIAPNAVAFVTTVCFGSMILTALPPLALSGWLVSRAFPLRPALAGALYGAGAGLMADAGWRLFCHFSDPAHVVGTHLAGIATVCLLGALTATFLQRHRRADA